MDQDTAAAPAPEKSWWQKGLDYAGQAGVLAEQELSVAKGWAGAAGEAGEKVLPIANTVVGLASAADDLSTASEAKERGDQQGANMANAKAVYDGASAIPVVGSALGLADMIGKGVGAAVGWDEEKEGGSIMNYGTERLMEDVGLLNHADTASEKDSKAMAHQAMQDEAAGPQHPIQALAQPAPDPNDPLAVPEEGTIPRPPGM